MVGFDVISDLSLEPDDHFNWAGKAESLYCIVAGNISNDLRTIHQTLTQLSFFYQGIFYVTGSLEYENVPNIDLRSNEISTICNNIRNVTLLYNHVVILDGIAVVGANGWYGQKNVQSYAKQFSDIAYLGMSLERLQLHLDVVKIIIVTHSVPKPELYFGEEEMDIYDQMPPSTCLASDTMHKVTHWIFGSYNKEVDTMIDGIHYVNNACYRRSPYWGKRINV